MNLSALMLDWHLMISLVSGLIWTGICLDRGRCFLLFAALVVDVSVQILTGICLDRGLLLHIFFQPVFPRGASRIHLTRRFATLRHHAQHTVVLRQRREKNKKVPKNFVQPKCTHPLATTGPPLHIPNLPEWEVGCICKGGPVVTRGCVHFGWTKFLGTF